MAYALLGSLLLAGGVLSLIFKDSSPVAALSSMSSSLGGLKRSQDGGGSSSGGKNDNANGKEMPIAPESYLPEDLFNLGLYQESDFVNEIGISPPHWKPEANDGSGRTWGPCYPGQQERKNKVGGINIDWYDDRNNTEFKYLHGNPKDNRWGGPSYGKSGLCRPGFIILGQGKCGTSSLYHYLLGHPRVAPAVEKQIHYFIVRIG
jgi:hypothetical protein